MHIGVLTTQLSEEEARLVEAGKQRGYKVTPLPVLECSITICPNDPKLYIRGQKISEEFDVIIPRIDLPHIYHGLTVLRQFQAMGIYTTDTAYSLELGRDKIRCSQYLMRKNVPFPTTGFAYAKENFDSIINTVGGAPLVIKLNEGTEGVGVFLAEDEKQAKNFLSTFKQLDARIMTQEFIAESSGADIRCFVVGDKIVASMQRKSQNGDFRANLSLGGETTPVEITEEEEDIVLRSAKAIGLNVAGVDLIRSKNGPLIIEVNTSADFAYKGNIEDVTGVDVAGHIIDFAVAGKNTFDASDETGWLDSQI
ncbi:RimK family alpha-L-glutamate ligase [Alphaproteobacteria bacterium]|nr:RimK family alpha-L-glutamate ligase [Alphaproteobacteria bacterium]